MSASQGKLAVVIPAYNAASTLPDCLNALAKSNRKPDAIVLFDDGSTDDTALIARSAGVVVVGNGGSRQGPAIGRNYAAGLTEADTIVFVDADVAVHADALGRLEAPLIRTDAVAAFGSYDDHPKSRRLSALYANLRHHWVHQQGRAEAFTFWSGLGAIRRTTFQAHRGFDPMFEEPSIEDVELGIRIVEGGGRIALVKDALGTHHKDWGLGQLWKTDIFRRAIPWARLMRDGRGSANDLNISKRERAAAVCAHLVWVAALFTVWRPTLWPFVPLAAAAYIALNFQFFAFLFRAAGLRAGLAGIALHWCYHLYASGTYALVASGLLSFHMRSRMAQARAGSTQATRP